MVGGGGLIKLDDIALAVVVADGDRFPARRRAFEHIDAGLPAVFDTNRVLGYTKPLIGVEDHVCRLLAQQRGQFEKADALPQDDRAAFTADRKYTCIQCAGAYCAFCEAVAALGEGGTV